MNDHAMTAAKARKLASEYRARSMETGISQKRTSLLTNISRTFSGLASQLEMLEADVAEERKGLQ
jgi:hypothetical protein